MRGGQVRVSSGCFFSDKQVIFDFNTLCVWGGAQENIQEQARQATVWACRKRGSGRKEGSGSSPACGGRIMGSAEELGKIGRRNAANYHKVVA